MNRNTVILGGGESGYGSAILAKREGYNVFLSDSGTLAERYKTALCEANIAFEEGIHSLDKILIADMVIKSPGIPESAAIVTMIREREIPIISEIEFAGRYCKAKIISITGSNGKTTTATLTHKILLEGGVNVALAGNIGDSYALSVATSTPDWYVLELSSFQLDGCYDFHSDISILTNITPDHLDRYKYDMSLYIASKFRVARNQTSDDIFIINSSDKESTTYLQSNSVGGNITPINIEKTDNIYSDGATLSCDGKSIICRYKERELTINIDDIKLKGLHNYANIMDSVLAAMAVGVDSESIIKSVFSFEGVEHRMEFVLERGGVIYINDSKATNVDSTWYALESMNRPTVWIAGGTDKGNDYTPLVEFVKRSVRVLICMGKDNRKLMSFFKDIVPEIYDTNSLDGAFEVIKSVSKEGDTVLLSPCSASFDLFSNYEDRGRKFKDRCKLG